MNKTVVLVNEWDAYEQKHAEGTIADFCRYYLANEKVEAEEGIFPRPPSDESFLMKTLGLTVGSFGIYFRAAMAAAEMPFPEAFYLLNSLRHLKECKKTDLINYMLMEYTTGSDAIAKLVKLGLISERQHDTDKRAKLLELTTEGEQKLMACYPYMHKATKMIFKDMDPDSLKLCISMLSKIETKHSRLSVAVRHLDFDGMYNEVMKDN